MRDLVFSRFTVLFSILVMVGLLLGAGIFLLRIPQAVALASSDPLASTITALQSTAPITGQLPAALQNSLQADNGAASGVIAIPSASNLSCATPIVLNGSIVTSTSPQYTGRLIRNGVPSICGEDYSCSGTQSTSTHFSYQQFDLLNPSTNWQCVRVDLDARSCSQQVYSAAYLNTFSPANLCTNIQGAMGFSTSGIYGYSLMVPPNTNFSIVNNTTGIVPPSANCANYTMTVSLCSSAPDIKVDKGQGPSPLTLHTNVSGTLSTTVPVFFTNTGNFTATMDARTVSETVKITVLDNKPAAVQATFGHAGAIVPPGKIISTTIPLEFSGSKFQCLPRTYLLTSQLTMTQNTYYCNGYNPPSAQVFTGSVLPKENFDEDGWAFQATPGDQITVTVDTVSAATAFDLEACLSGTPNGACLPGFQGDDNFTCSFPPPAFACPRFGGILPADPDGDNIYYVRANSGSGAGNFVGPVGNYRGTILITSGPTGACPVVQYLDNGVDSFVTTASNEFNLAGAVLSPTTTITAQVFPIQVIVPPSDPANPSCGVQYLPLVKR